MKAVLALVILVAAAAWPLGDPLARFSYSPDLAQRLNQRQDAATAFLVDDIRGKEFGGAVLLDAIHALIRAFPACGVRQLRFAYAYGQTADAHVVAFGQAGERAPKCPAITIVKLSPTSGAVTVRSLPETLSASTCSTGSCPANSGPH